MNPSVPSLGEIHGLCLRHAGALAEALLIAAERAFQGNDANELTEETFWHLRSTLYVREPVWVLEPAVLLATALDTRLPDTVVGTTFRALLPKLLAGARLNALVNAMSLAEIARVVGGLMREQNLDDEERPLVVPVLEALRRRDGRSAAVAAERAAYLLARPLEKEDWVVDTLDCAMNALVLSAVACRFAAALD
jgi:hypothetical protein